MSAIDNCPHCNAILIGPEIPEDVREHYGDKTHYRREIMVEVPGVYDGGLYFRCPFCGGAWHRFKSDDPYYVMLREKAQPYIDEENLRAANK